MASLGLAIDQLVQSGVLPGGGLLRGDTLEDAASQMGEADTVEEELEALKRDIASG